jgi:hypothetical protein
MAKWKRRKTPVRMRNKWESTGIDEQEKDASKDTVVVAKQKQIDARIETDGICNQRGSGLKEENGGTRGFIQQQHYKDSVKSASTNHELVD